MNIQSDVKALIGEIDFDPDVLLAKYRTERDKRLRLDGNAQYVEAQAESSRYVDDPQPDSKFERAPVFDEVGFAIIGGGFGGLLMAARLRESGFKQRLRIIDNAGDFGGTWYWNRYPGAMCDVESYCYLPLLEELGYIPKHKYSFAPEIFEHSQRIAQHYRLYEDALLRTTIVDLRWDADDLRWIIRTDRNDCFKAQYVTIANGRLSSPKLPRMPGLGGFKGHAFHTSRWDYQYTGGDSFGNLVGLRDKRVGIIGTGATAVQCIPHLGASASHLYVFQRTPSSIDVRNNCETDPNWAASLEPGWQNRRMENFNALVGGDDQEEDLVHDGWTDIFRNLTGVAAREATKKLGRPLTGEERAQLLELADYRKMNQIRARVDLIVKDPTTAALLKPWYRQFCKRPCFHDEYLQTYNRPNVTLVDTDGKGVERLTSHGVVANGREYEVDCLVFATGFETGSAYNRRAGYEIVGISGTTLSQHWSEGFRTMHGLMACGFPNCFFLATHTATTVNAPLGLSKQAEQIAYIITQSRARGFNVLEPKAEAEEAYVQEVLRLAGIGMQYYIECTPGYYNGEGDVRKSYFEGNYGAGSLQFFGILDRWRREGSMQGIAMR